MDHFSKSRTVNALGSAKVQLMAVDKELDYAMSEIQKLPRSDGTDWKAFSVGQGNVIRNLEASNSALQRRINTLIDKLGET